MAVTVTDVSTVKSGYEYRATIGGVRYALIRTTVDSLPMVAVYPPTGRAGLYRLDRFAGFHLNPDSIKTMFTMTKGGAP